MKNKTKDFIKKATLGAVGLSLGTNSLSAKSYNNIIGANDRINLTIQGLSRRYPAYIPPIMHKDNNVTKGIGI